MKKRPGFFSARSCETNCKFGFNNSKDLRNTRRGPRNSRNYLWDNSNRGRSWCNRHCILFYPNYLFL